MSRAHGPLHLPSAWLGLTVAACVVAGAPAAAQTWDTFPVNPKVDIAYIPPASAELQNVYQKLKKRQVLEEYQHFLAPVHLPHRLRMMTRECDENHDRPDKGVNAWYSTDRSLTLCYEFVVAAANRAPQTVSPDGFITREAAIIGSVVGTLLHESGHMLFDMLDVSVFGREEDAADETAALIALQFNNEVARTLVKGFVYQWATQDDPAAKDPMRVYSDEHGTASQRMYNTLCLAYGGDAQNFQEFVDRGWLPKKRADHCAQELALVRRAFVKMIMPYVDRDLMARAQKTQWLTPEELK